MNNRIRSIGKAVDQLFRKRMLVMIGVREHGKPIRVMTVQREQIDIFRSIYGEENVHVY